MFKKLSDILDLKTVNHSSPKHSYASSFNFLALIHRWPDIVGPKLSKVTIPLKNQNNTLTILTEHPAYSQSLSFLEETLKEKIYRVFPELQGKIKSFYFNVSTEHFKDQQKSLLQRTESWAKHGSGFHTQSNVKKNSKLHEHNPEYRKLKNQALEHFQNIEDEEIKAALVSLYIQIRI